MKKKLKKAQLAQDLYSAIQNIFFKGLKPLKNIRVRVDMNTSLTRQTMNIDQIKNELIKSAQSKLQMHKRMGRDSKLSIMEVAQLVDIISGNIEESNFNRAQFFGLHSLN